MKQGDYYEEYGQNFLVLDGRVHSMSNSTIKDEIRLYNLSKEKYHKTIELFNRITGKSISDKSQVTELSGGQKLILSALIALESPARNIIFFDYFIALHQSKKDVLYSLIEKYRTYKNIKIINL